MHLVKTFFALPGLDLGFSVFLDGSEQFAKFHLSISSSLSRSVAGKKTSASSKYSSSSIFFSEHSFLLELSKRLHVCLKIRKLNHCNHTSLIGLMAH